MGTEIERKFILRAVPEWVSETEGSAIRQGYLAAGAGAEVRVRLRDGSPRLTVKRGEGLARDETEIDLADAQFAALWPLTEGQRIEKTRYRHPLGDLTLEVDVYEGPHAGLVVAEIEFASIAESRSFEPPDWLGREVTGDERWTNRSLALAAEMPAIAE